jgi:hypothetical protein
MDIDKEYENNQKQQQQQKAAAIATTARFLSHNEIDYCKTRPQLTKTKKMILTENVIRESRADLSITCITPTGRRYL